MKQSKRILKKGQAEALTDWRAETLARVRKLIKEADPDVVEEVKWRKPSNAMRGVPVWEHAGIVCTGEMYQDKVKLTFAYGAALDDPSGVFNASLDGNTRRAIDLHEGDTIDAKALQDAHSRRNGAEYVESCRSPRPRAEEAKARLRRVAGPAMTAAGFREVLSLKIDCVIERVIAGLDPAIHSTDLSTC
jgi:hypothetical protein